MCGRGKRQPPRCRTRGHPVQQGGTGPISGAEIKHTGAGAIPEDADSVGPWDIYRAICIGPCPARLLKSECDCRGRRAVCRDVGDGRDEQARPGRGPTHPLFKRRARRPREERLLGGGGETLERGPASLPVGGGASQVSTHLEKTSRRQGSSGRISRKCQSKSGQIR